jgi:hydroxyacylglutathione hydrolase
VDLDRLTEIAPGVLVATAEPYVTTTTVVVGPAGSCLLIDPAVTVAELTGLAASLSARGLRPVAGWSTHPHWDHVLWHPAFGPDVPRFAAPAAVAAVARERDRILKATEETAPGHDPSFIGQLTSLAAGAIPWDGPAADIIVHSAHAPGHGAVFLPDSGVLVAGDMCSDIEMPLLDMDTADPLGDYRTGLARLAAVPGVRQVVPGHGHVGDAEEFRRRLAADTAYLDKLERPTPFDDSRITRDWLRAVHNAQLDRFRH